MGFFPFSFTLNRSSSYQTQKDCLNLHYFSSLPSSLYLVIEHAHKSQATLLSYIVKRVWALSNSLLKRYIFFLIVFILVKSQLQFILFINFRTCIHQKNTTYICDTQKIPQWRMSKIKAQMREWSLDNTHQDKLQTGQGVSQLTTRSRKTRNDHIEKTIIIVKKRNIS